MYIFVVIFVPVLQSLLQLSVVTARRIQVETAYVLALLRDNVPDQLLASEDQQKMGERSPWLEQNTTIKVCFVKYAERKRARVKPHKKVMVHGSQSHFRTGKR